MFSFGLKAKIDGLVALQERLKKFQDSWVRVGVFDSAGTHAGSKISMAALATIHEFGSDAAHVPERSFIRATFRARQEEGAAYCGRVCGAYVAGRIELEAALNLVGEWWVVAVQEFILTNQIRPPDAPATVARKGTDTVLVDTAQLLASISYRTPFGERVSAQAPVDGGAE